MDEMGKVMGVLMPMIRGKADGKEANQIVRAGDGPAGLEILGRVTSVRRSPTLDKVVGLAWLPSTHSDPGTSFTIRSRGELIGGQVV